MSNNCAWFVAREEHAADTLAALPVFQALMGVPDAEAARERCHFEIVTRVDETREVMSPMELDHVRPYALIHSQNPTITNVGTGPALVFGGELNILFEMNMDDIASRIDQETVTQAEILRWFKNQCGQVVQEFARQWSDEFLRTLAIDWANSPRIVTEGDIPHVYFWIGFQYGAD